MVKTKCAILILVSAAWTGCRSPSQYTSPRVIGRVLDGQTQQPIAGAQVRKMSSSTPSMETPRGGEMLMRSPIERTRTDGQFILESERALSFFGRSHWFGVTLSFTHPHYEPMVKTYPYSSSTVSATGEPLVEAGDVLLQSVAPQKSSTD